MPSPNRILTLLLLLVVSCVTAADAKQPTLHEIAKRLTDAEGGDQWRFENVTQSVEQFPGDAELQLRHSTEDILIGFAGPREAVRSVTVVVGPTDLDSPSAKRAVVLARKTLAATSGIGEEVLAEWLRDNGPAFRSGNPIRLLKQDDGRHLTGQSWESPDGRTVVMSCDFPKASFIHNGDLGVRLTDFLRSLEATGDWEIEHTNDMQGGFSKTICNQRGARFCKMHLAAQDGIVTNCSIWSALPIRAKGEVEREYITRAEESLTPIALAFGAIDDIDGWETGHLFQWFVDSYAGALEGMRPNDVATGKHQASLTILTADEDAAGFAFSVSGEVTEDAVPWEEWLEDHPRVADILNQATRP